MPRSNCIPAFFLENRSLDHRIFLFAYISTISGIPG